MGTFGQRDAIRPAHGEQSGHERRAFATSAESGRLRHDRCRRDGNRARPLVPGRICPAQPAGRHRDGARGDCAARAAIHGSRLRHRTGRRPLETARTIAELRDDLDRAGVAGSSARLSLRIHEATSGITEAAEAIQEIAWTLREAGSAPELCDRLDRRATEIYGATTVIEAGADQIEKVADTIAMLDSTLRATVDRPAPALAELPPPIPATASETPRRSAARRAPTRRTSTWSKPARNSARR